MGNDIYFSATPNYPPDIICLAMITPWELTEYVGPLPRGTYAVYAGFGDVWMTDFIVSGNPDIFDDGCVDLLDLAIFAKAWMAQAGDDNWDPDCNIAEPSDNVINGRDLAVLAHNWLRCEPSS
jgi:hypothetical protein